MKQPRFSIAGVMGLVLVVALNLATGRRLLLMHAEKLAVGLVLSVPLLELGLWRLACCRGRARAFWAGFVICGLLAAGSYVLTWLEPHFGVIDGNTGVSVDVPGSPLNVPWEYYLRHAGRPFVALLQRRVGTTTTSYQIVNMTGSVTVLAFPQITAALAGGFPARVLHARCTKGRASASAQVIESGAAE